MSLFLKIIILTGIVLVISSLAVFIYGVYVSDNNPPWGPLIDNPQATFTVQKENNDYILQYIYRQKSGRINIGASAVDLAPFVGKTVHMTGHYYASSSSATQCIAGNCHVISPDPHLAVIETIEELK
ncbi:hypothetical protein HYV22_03600 [Candidatus Gottesmanbacteria bacterium]|nr:hypothetical protein [Candidatus Gottesmanbacteria bacterium]